MGETITLKFARGLGFLSAYLFVTFVIFGILHWRGIVQDYWVIAVLAAVVSIIGFTLRRWLS